MIIINDISLANKILNINTDIISRILDEAVSTSNRTPPAPIHAAIAILHGMNKLHNSPTAYGQKPSKK
ncbi:MAG: hypothetical protein LBL90_03445 [Prevotellaceae bacterium]|jgi:hypothetical protein|nr:hypothetical protein [Prevotellaceae bacterium]